jgi:hypothetical protein
MLALVAGIAALGWLVGQQLPLGWWKPTAASKAAVADAPQQPEAPLASQVEAVQRGISATIHVESQALADEDLASLARLAGLQVLLLDNAGNSISDRGCERLRGMAHLIHLRIRGGSIGDDGLAHLARLPQLKILNLPHCRATDRGLAILAPMPRLSQLRLGSDRITDAGLKELHRFSALTQMHLIGAPITDAGLEEFARLDKLESLYVDDSRVTDEGLERLFRARPDLHVHINQQHHDRDPRRGHE